MLVINKEEPMIKLYLHEFKEEITLMTTDGTGNCPLLRFNKITHLVSKAPDIPERMGFVVDKFGQLIITETL